MLYCHKDLLQQYASCQLSFWEKNLSLFDCGVIRKNTLAALSAYTKHAVNLLFENKNKSWELIYCCRRLLEYNSAIAIIDFLKALRGEGELWVAGGKWQP